MAKRRGHGEGSICQRTDGRWTAPVDLGWEDGKRKRKAVYGKTRQEVAGKISGLLSDQQKGLNPTDDKTTVAQYLENWLE